MRYKGEYSPSYLADPVRALLPFLESNFSLILVHIYRKNTLGTL